MIFIISKSVKRHSLVKALIATMPLIATASYAQEYGWYAGDFNNLTDSANAACAGYDMASIGYPHLSFVRAEVIGESSQGALCWHEQTPGIEVNLVNAGIRYLHDVEDKNQGEPGECAGTNPINITVANKYQREDDYIAGAVFPLMVSRVYNSRAGSWRFFPEIDESVGGAVSVIRADGKKLFFLSNGNKGWTSDEDVTGILDRLEGNSGTHTGWRYTTLDQQVEEYDADGTIVSITNRAGISHTHVVTSTEITVTHSNGDVLTYQRDSSGGISGFTTPDGDQYTYIIDTQNRLAGIAYPNNGGTRTYHYEDTNFPFALTGITDENGNRFATWVYDTEGRAISSEHDGGADLVTLDYTHIDDAVDPRVVATNPLGKKTTYHFTTIHGVRKVTQVEGHQSANCAAANKAYTYDANGFLASKTDWKGNTTTYTRNAKGQELTRVEASGTPEARTITTEWHTTFNLPTRITEPEQETVITYDANGNELTRVISEVATP